jgi:hypothetical protein
MVDRDRQIVTAELGAQGPGHFCLTLHVAMQLGLYLPGLAALSGVQSLRILDWLRAPPIAPSCTDPLRSWRGRGRGAGESRLR